MAVVWEFLMERGRLPCLTDDPKPWTYEAWLLPYVQQIQRAHPAISDRWGYLLETHAAGCFLDAPLPRVEFVSEHTAESRQVVKAIEGYLTILERHGSWQSFRVFVDFLAFGLGVIYEPPMIDDSEAEKLYRQVNILPWLLSPCDHLGSFLSVRRGKGWNPLAFYPTPGALCEIVSALTMEGLRADNKDVDERALAVNDPCVGTGRFLLYASNYSMNLSGQDLDPLVLLITKVNGALYAPWINKPPREAIDKALSAVGAA